MSRALAVVKLTYYALGGGLGHLTRALAIINALDRLRSGAFHFTLITNSPFAAQLNIERFAQNLTPISITSQTELNPHLDRLLQQPVDLLLVDTFPRGLMGELVTYLPQLNCPRLLIQRYLKPDYLNKFAVAEFVSANYQGSLRLSDNLPAQHLHPRTYQLSAVTLESIDSSTEPTTADIILFDQSSDRPKLLLLDFGPSTESFIKVIPHDFQFRVITVDCERTKKLINAIEYYPAARLFSQADLIIGGCGYNLFHELLDSQQDAIFIPQSQIYDDQYGRARGYPQATTISEFQQQLQQWYKNWQSHDKKAILTEPNSVDVINGAQQAAAIINKYINHEEHEEFKI